MVRYELCMVMRNMAKDAVVQRLEPLCAAVLQDGGVVRKLQAQAKKPLPYRMRTTHGYFTEGRTVFCEFDSPTATLDRIALMFNQDRDVIRYNVVRLPSITQTVKTCRRARQHESAQQRESRYQEQAASVTAANAASAPPADHPTDHPSLDSA